MGQLIGGRYASVQQVGRGHFGEVYLAIDQVTKRDVAIKFLTKSVAIDRFRREARMLQDYAHPHVVEVIEARLDHVPPFIAMEYCRFGSLRSWVENRRSWRDVTVALVQAAMGLTALHAQGGFHRDIKPDNLLIARDPTEAGAVVKVGDFGVAREPVTEGPMTRSAWGTDGYRAPETLNGGAHTTASDVYSLGVVAVELITGQRDFAWLAAARSSPTALRELVSSMCEQDPARRPSMRGVAEAGGLLLNQPVAPPAIAAGQAAAADDLGGLLFKGLLVAGVIWAFSKK